MLGLMRLWIWKGGQTMGRKRYTVDQIISKLRQAEVELARGRKVPEVARKLGISEFT